MWWFLPLLLTPTFAFNVEPKAPTRTTRNTPEERWVNVRVNHMMAVNTDTYPMRFYYNNAEWDQNVVIVVGGDWEITPEWTDGGLASNIANNIDASIFYPEHRFYGQSRLGDSTSMSQLRFLTVDQALGDLAQFITYIKSENFEYGRYSSSKVVLVGCSFGGTLATWMRLTHPHLVQAVVSDSGPLYAREEVPEYLEVLSEVLRVHGGEACLTSIEDAVAEIGAAIQTTEGLARVSQLFNTCTPLAASTPLDVATFWAAIIDALATLASGSDAASAACLTLNATSTETPMVRLASWFNQQQSADSCLLTSYTGLITSLTNTSYESPLLHSRLWLYQSCSQFGWLPTTSSSRSPFQGAVPVDYYHQLCTDVFSDHFNREFLLSGISRTNLFFAGLSHLPDYVVSVTSTHDLYYSAGPNRTHATLKAPVYVAQDALKCSVLSSTLNDSPTEENFQLKLQVLNDVQYFIGGVIFAGSARVGITALLLAAAAIATLLS